MSPEEKIAHYDHIRATWAAARRRARAKAAAQLKEAKQQGSDIVPRLAAEHRERATRYYYKKVRPRLLEEQAKKGSLSAQWELENHAAKEAWVLERAAKQRALADLKRKASEQRPAEVPPGQAAQS